MPQVTLTQAIGALVKELRGDMTQGELSAASGVPQSTISAIERGNRTFRGVHLEAILSATNTSGVEATRLLRALAEHASTAPTRAIASARQQPAESDAIEAGIAEGDKLALESAARHALRARPVRNSHGPRPPGPRHPLTKR